MRVICFYLPQFHPIPENDRWWGKGFTEWRNVARARPLFPGHHQPRLPADLGYYDLRLPEVREEQAALAREHGIHGFCYYHYWFGGKRLLERPFDEVLTSGRPNFPFCLAWANEHWSRRWDGSEHEVLVEQQYDDTMAGDFIDSLLPAFKDPRYIRIDGKPLLLVYRVHLLDNPRRSIARWREHAKANGIDDIYVCRMNTFCEYGLEEDPGPQGFDACVEFPPHGCSTWDLAATLIAGRSIEPGVVYDYEQVVHRSVHRRQPPYKMFRTVMPSWDNTARKPTSPQIFFGATPDKYQRWLTEMIRWTARHRQGDEQLVFINAWNEWAEGAYLEPDQRFGKRYLEATAQAVRTALSDRSGTNVLDGHDRTLEPAGYALATPTTVTRDGETLLPSATVKGAVDNITRYDGRLWLNGWAADASAPFKPLHILLFDGSRLIGQARTGRPRLDLAGSGGIERIDVGFQFGAWSSDLSNHDVLDLRAFAISERLEYAMLSLPTAGEQEAAGAGAAGSGASREGTGK